MYKGLVSARLAMTDQNKSGEEITVFQFVMLLCLVSVVLFTLAGMY